MKHEQKVQIATNRFKEEIREALREGQNWAEINEAMDRIHFCRLNENSTPMDWSWGPYALSFPIEETVFTLTKVRVEDWSSYESGQSSDGGCYAFFEEYDRVIFGLAETRYSTTADLPYCSCCGVFGHQEWEECPNEGQRETQKLPTIGELVRKKNGGDVRVFLTLSRA